MCLDIPAATNVQYIGIDNIFNILLNCFTCIFCDCVCADCALYMTWWAVFQNPEAGLKLDQV